MLLKLALLVLNLPLLTGCWVQSVYPFYRDSDVIVDPTLTGTWAGDEELKSCLLKIALDSETQTYKLELSSSEAGVAKQDSDAQCAPAKLEGRLAQVGSVRFFDVSMDDPDKFWPATLQVVVKIEIDKQSLTLIPLDAEWMANALDKNETKLQGRVQESGGLLPIVGVTLVSPTKDLREFLASADGKSAFSDSGRMRFSRRQQ
jgi:hypothetical protein